MALPALERLMQCVKSIPATQSSAAVSSGITPAVAKPIIASTSVAAINM